MLRSCIVKNRTKLDSSNGNNNGNGGNGTINDTYIEIICTCGADGNAILWKIIEKNRMFTKKQLIVLPHSPGSQIYVCESINDTYFMTAADDMFD
mgnify:FL=1